MLNIITYDGTNPKEFMKYRERGYIDLTDTRTIEDGFNSLFNKMLWKEDEGWWDGPGPRLHDPFDIAIMKEIDCAERCDLLVVKTHIGTAPLTCLSTGCKFGLLVNYWTKEGCKIVASWDSAGENVFEFLGRELDITIYMDKKSLVQYFVSRDLKNVLIDGKEIAEFDEDEINQNLLQKRAHLLHKWALFYSTSELAKQLDKMLVIVERGRKNELESILAQIQEETRVRKIASDYRKIRKEPEGGIPLSDEESDRFWGAGLYYPV